MTKTSKGYRRESVAFVLFAKRYYLINTFDVLLPWRVM